MAYNITFYSKTQNLEPSLILDSIVSYADTRGLAIRVTEKSSGDGWVSGDLAIEQDNADGYSVRLEAHANSALVNVMIEQGKSEGGGVALDDVDTVLIMTLPSGSVNWKLVRAAWDAIDVQWPTVAYDEVSGFDTSIDALE